MLGSHRLVAVTEFWRNATAARWLCTCQYWTAVLLKLKLVPVSKYIKNMEHMNDGKFIEIYVCQKLSL